ncbi:DUF4300 family protein [Capnocytophaga stomatis]|uniref:DUF4300 family protein n=1 Tax=Capnocytophaga stomatis TaxID=1848904 RepID=UPI00385A8AEC
MKKRNFVMTLLAIGFLGCQNPKPKASENVNISTENTEQPFLKSMEYSNLVDKATQEEVGEALIAAGIDKQLVGSFFENVNTFNQTVGEVGLVKEGFATSDDLIISYDEASIQTQWDEKNPEFIGYNCRITSFDMFRDLVSTGNPKGINSSNLFLDKDALNTNAKKVFSQEENERFLCLFSRVLTGYHKDVAQHLEKVKQAFKEREVHFPYKGDTSKASLISIFFHSAITDEPDDVFLFVGHVGVLVPMKDGKLLFVEKLAFQEPYQAIKFNNRTELNDYLMNRYDVEKGQPTAKPFIMENDELMQGYRPNPNNKE